MSHMNLIKWIVLPLAGMLAVWSSACDDDDRQIDADGDVDGDMDADSDGDADGDGDSDADADGDSDGAFRWLRRCVRYNPGEAAPHLARARVCKFAGRRARAAAAYAHACRLEPEVCDHACSFGRALMEAGAFDRAAAVLDSVIERFPDESAPYAVMADLALRRPP